MYCAAVECNVFFMGGGRADGDDGPADAASRELFYFFYFSFYGFGVKNGFWLILASLLHYLHVAHTFYRQRVLN